MTDQTGQRKPRTPKATKLPGIPKPPADASPSLRQYLTSVSEALEVRLGRKGDPRDAAVTFRDLIESGVAVEVYYGGGGGGGISYPGGPGDPDGPGQPGIEDPTAPTGLQASGAMYSISVWWNAARYEYGGHSYTEVWRAPAPEDENGDITGVEPTIADAVLIGSSVGTAYVDPVEPGRTYYYWARHVNLEGDIGPYGFPYPQGLKAFTEPDIEVILEALEGMIGEDQLTQELQGQIALIDELEGFTGYYDSWRVDGDLVQRINAISSSSDGNQIIIEELSQVVDGLEAQYTVKIQTNTAGGGKYVAGFGLASSPVNGVPTSRFIVAADQFAVIEPATYNLSDGQALNDNTIDPYTPFQIITTPTSYDGIDIPRGVYIKDAYMGKARILQLIAGDINADYIRANKYISGPSIHAASINIGTLVKPDPDRPKTWYLNGSQRVGNFSVTSDGYMEARGAKLYELTVYDSNNNIILDSGGARAKQPTGNNYVYNSHFNDGIDGWTTNGVIGSTVVFGYDNSAGKYYVDTAGGTWIQGTTEFPIDSNEPLYLFGESRGVNAYYALVQYSASGQTYGNFLSAGMPEPSFSNDTLFRIGTLDPTNGYIKAKFRLGTVSGGATSRHYFVGCSTTPPVLDSSYASTYIKSLYVNQLTGDVNTITAFSGSGYRTIGPSSANYKEMFTAICEQNSVSAIDHEATISGVFSAQYRTDTAYVKLEWRRRNSRNQASNSWNGWTEVNVLKHKTSEGGSSWTTLPFAGGTGQRYNTDVQFRVSVYMRNDNDSGNTDKSRSSTIEYSGTTIGVV